MKNARIIYDVEREIARRAAHDAASSYAVGNVFSGMRYVTYFALCAVGDEKLTFRALFCDAGGRVKGSVILVGHEAVAALDKPSSIVGAAARAKGKYIVASLSAPAGMEQKSAYDVAERLFSQRGAKLFDFILINKGKTYSLVRGITG